MTASTGGPAGATDDDIRARIDAVRQGIERACERSGREPGDVLLIGATKAVPVDRIAGAAAAGLTDVGENRAAELAEKAPLLGRIPLVWHFLGKLQTGTVGHVARHADVVHSAEPGKALEKLARREGRDARVLPLLIEVDFTGRRQGVEPDGLGAFARLLDGLPAVRLRGLMTVPPFTPDPADARRFFERLRRLRDRLVEDHPDARELSMGMSSDYTIAVEEGATMVRVGTAIFGERRAVAVN